MSAPSTTRVGAILAVSNVESSVAFYRDRLGFELEASYDDPPYATLVLDDTRLSLAEQGYRAEDRPGVLMEAPRDTSRLQVVLVLEVTDCRGSFEELRDEGVEFLADPYSPPWGGARCFAVDPDRYLVELEEPA